jgi:diguanylate cyclase (GGDEF)-like protein/PAS domain S-box-containing protein
MLHVALISITYIYSKNTEMLHYSQTFRQLTSITDMRLHKLEIFFSYRTSDIRALAASETINNLATQLYQIGERQHRQEQMQSPSPYADAVAVQQKYHHYLHSFLKEYNYTNAILVDATHGDIMFSTDKHLDVGTNLESDAMKNSILARLWYNTKNTATTQMSDIHLDSHYGETPMMFLGSPVIIDDKPVAILVLQLPGNTINEIMHLRSGMGKSGESYAVGQDHLMRSDSYLEPRYFSVVSSFGNPSKYAVNTLAVERAIAGKHGTDIITDYRGVRVLSAYEPFETKNFTWAIISEIDESEVQEQIAQTQKNIVLWAMLISVSITVIAYFLIRRIIDISVIRPLEASFQRAQNFEAIINNSLNEVYIFDAHDLHFTYVNRGAILNTGYALEEMRQMTPMEIMPEFSKDHFLQLIEPLLHQEREQVAFETIHERKDDSRYDVDARLQLMTIEGKERFVAIINDITERNWALMDKERFYELSTHDHLTQIYNRQKFDELFKQEIERSRRYGGPITLVIFDIDHFKQINDTYGHKSGDTVLTSLTRYVHHELRSSDIFARWGGEEFVILMPNTNYETTLHKTEHLRLGIKRLDIPDVGSVTCSFGVADVETAKEPEATLERADAALYRAKQTGRNRVCGSDEINPVC